MATITGTDTTWKTYTASENAGCGSDQSISLLVSPVMSASTMQTIAAQAPQVLQVDTGKIQLTFTVGTNTYIYSVDTKRWLTTGLDISGVTLYSAGYYWGDLDGVPVLEKVGLNHDSTLSGGGVKFKNIYVNETLRADRRLTAVPRPGFSVRMFRGGIALSGDALGHDTGNITIRNAAGRIISFDVIGIGINRFVWKGLNASGRHVAAGSYIVEYSTNNAKYSHPIFLIQ